VLGRFFPNPHSTTLSRNSQNLFSFQRAALRLVLKKRGLRFLRCISTLNSPDGDLLKKFPLANFPGACYSLRDGFYERSALAGRFARLKRIVSHHSPDPPPVAPLRLDALLRG
jgi:hypothetical protein